MSIVDETVQDRVGVGGIADDFVPTVDRKLGGDHRGAASIALFEDFQQIMAGGGVERLQAPIIEDEKVGSAEVAQDAGMATVPARQREILEQTGRRLSREPTDCRDRLCGQALRPANFCRRLSDRREPNCRGR